MNKISSLFQDIEIRYYWMMSSIAQLQRRNSSRITHINSDSSEKYTITEKNGSHLLNSQAEKIEYEKKAGVAA